MSTVASPMAADTAISWAAAAESLAAVGSTGRLISETEFAAVYAAADFAAEFEMWMDTSVTINWSLLGVTEDDSAQLAFTGFTKCLRDWLIRRANPVAFVFAHELGPVVGLHSHVNVYVAGERQRVQFRHWVRDWSDHVAGRHVPRAVRVAGPRVSEPWLHWLRFCYLMKGYDRDCVVQSGRVSPDGQDVRLGDLIPFAWINPGNFGLKKRVGASRSLGPDRRSFGAPTGFDYLLDQPRLDPAINTWLSLPAQGGNLAKRTKSFRSKYEDGARDVRTLYGPEFFERVTGCSPSVGKCMVDDDIDRDWLASIEI
ncbi:MAG: hypothetical protein K2X57_26325 [Xanthobacteraceae bacterium]|nr:hypothetical protein [Xanthobacteraceae bacterium]